MTTFGAPAGAGACPLLAAETAYFAAIEWNRPSGTGQFAWIPQTVPFEDDAASDEDPAGAAGWSIANTPTTSTPAPAAAPGTEFSGIASFKIVVNGATSDALTASITAVPESHDGQSVFTFELHFSEEFFLSYRVLRDDDAFTVTNGKITRARRLEPGKNIKRVIHVRPDGTADVTIVLPAATDCDAEGVICTPDGRMLSNTIEFTVSGPG